MTCTRQRYWNRWCAPGFRSLAVSPLVLVWLGASILVWGPAARAQTAPIAQTLGTGTSAVQQTPGSDGNISGTIVDATGATVAGAKVVLTREVQIPNQEVLTGDDGQFSFSDLAPGIFHITVTAPGFAPQTSSGTLYPAERYAAPPMALALAANVTDLDVVVPKSEVADEEVKEQEKQRVLGVVPNFYVSYVPDAASLSTKQKFQLAWKTTIDPVTFGVTGAIAGVQLAQNDFRDYGQGAQGYGKRFGASYANAVTSTFIGSAILPSLLKQDPRYFYEGSNKNTASRILYAIANAVICKGDDKNWQPNYSNILGNVASGAISNLYYPAANRSGVGLTFENALIGLGANAATNLLEEFVIRRLTPNLPNYESP